MGRVNLSTLPASAVSRILSDIKYESVVRKAEVSKYNQLSRYKVLQLANKQQKNALPHVHRQRIVSSKTHPIAKHLIKLANNAAYRRNKDSTLLTSKKLITDYCLLGRNVLKVYTNSVDHLPKGINFSQLIIVSKHILKSVVGVKNFNHGILAEVPLPKVSQNENTLGRRILALSFNKGKKTQHHLGTLLRTALAMRWDSVWLIGSGIPDFLDPLTIRISQGSLYHLPFRYGSIKELFEFAREHSFIVTTCSNDIDCFPSSSYGDSESTGSTSGNNTYNGADGSYTSNAASNDQVKKINNDATKGIILLVGQHSKEHDKSYNNSYMSYCINITGAANVKLPLTVDQVTKTALVMYLLS